MEKVVPPAVLGIYSKLKKEGYQAFFVGGCVRDFLMQRGIKDWDLTTDATPDQIQKVFPNSFYDNNFGTVGVIFETENETDKKFVEITTFRTESGYSNTRHPDQVIWGKSIEEDLSRRDFTMNSIAMSLDPISYVDPYSGVSDIERKIIRTVGNPNERFSEDALRLLRAIRFATQLSFKIEEETWVAIQKNADLITKISGERIRDELFKILDSDNVYEGILLLDKAGILDLIFPELAAGKNISQVRPGRHHTGDVFTHNIESLRHTPSKKSLVRLATLLHDVGKPFVKGEDEEGHVIFYNHEVKGAQIAYEISDRLRLSKKDREKIVKLIRWHMFSVDENITDSAVRRFIRKVGLENVEDIIDLRIGDRLGSGTKTAESWRLKNYKERIVKELNPPFSINDLTIDGNDIMKELKIKPGPTVGKILGKIFLEVDDNLDLNNREYLLKRIHELNEEET